MDDSPKLVPGSTQSKFLPSWNIVNIMHYKNQKANI